MDKMLRSEDETEGPVLAVGYIRSAGSGVDAEASAAAQKEQILEFANERGIQIVDWHVDMGCSGNDLERAGLQAVLAAARSPDRSFDAVVVYALNRLARNVAHLINIGDGLSESGVRVMSVAESVDWSAKHDFVSRIIEAFDAFQRGAHGPEHTSGFAHRR